MPPSTSAGMSATACVAEPVAVCASAPAPASAPALTSAPASAPAPASASALDPERVAVPVTVLATAASVAELRRSAVSARAFPSESARRPPRPRAGGGRTRAANGAAARGATDAAVRGGAKLPISAATAAPSDGRAAVLLERSAATRDSDGGMPPAGGCRGTLGATEAALVCTTTEAGGKSGTGSGLVHSPPHVSGYLAPATSPPSSRSLRLLCPLSSSSKSPTPASPPSSLSTSPSPATSASATTSMTAFAPQSTLPSRGPAVTSARNLRFTPMPIPLSASTASAAAAMAAEVERGCGRAGGDADGRSCRSDSDVSPRADGEGATVDGALRAGRGKCTASPAASAVRAPAPVVVPAPPAASPPSPPPTESQSPLATFGASPP